MQTFTISDLVWKEDGIAHISSLGKLSRWSAETPVGNFIVRQGANTYYAEFTTVKERIQYKWPCFSEEKAKKLCQLEYERRLVLMLDPAGETDEE